jgi:hypothetical protein
MRPGLYVQMQRGGVILIEVLPAPVAAPPQPPHLTREFQTPRRVVRPVVFWRHVPAFGRLEAIVLALYGAVLAMREERRPRLIGARA